MASYGTRFTELAPVQHGAVLARDDDLEAVWIGRGRPRSRCAEPSPQQDCEVAAYQPREPK